MGRLKGEGSYRKRSHDLWEGRITVGYEPVTGKQIIKSYYGKSKNEVKAKIRKVEIDVNAGILQHNVPELGDYLKHWFVVYIQANLKPATIELFNSNFKNHIAPAAISRKTIDCIQGFEYQEYFNYLATKLNKVSIRRIRSYLNRALNHAVLNKLISYNPCESTVLPNGIESIEVDDDDEFEYFNIYEHKALVEYLINVEVDIRLKAMILLDVNTGLRIGELVGLRKQDVDLKRAEVKVKGSIRRLATGLVYQKPKTKNAYRTVPIPKKLIPFLSAYVDLKEVQKKDAGELYHDAGFFFCTELGGIMDPRNLRRSYMRLLSRADISPRKFHALRHTYATRLMELGENPKVVQILMGHSSINITLSIYSHVTGEKKESAADKLNTLI